MREICSDIIPTKNTVLETIAEFGKEYKISMELKIDSVGSQYNNALDIENRHVSLWLSTDSKLMIDSKVSGASLKVYISDISVGSGTFYKLEISQSLIIDKVTINSLD